MEIGGRFTERVLSTVRKHSMLSNGERVLVAVSGGPDSTALLLALVYLSVHSNWTVAVFHLNHGLRPEADSEADYVRSLAEGLGLDAHIQADDVRSFCRDSKLGTQAGARELRYKWMGLIGEDFGFSKFAVGHTADDVVETFFMRLVRGSGPAGLRSIPPVRDRIVRPLIDTTRPEVLEFLREQGAGYIEDYSNNDRKYLRSKVRLDLIPLLSSLNPRIKERVLGTIDTLREDDLFLDALANKYFDDAAVVGWNDVALPLASFTNLGASLSRRVLRLGVRKLTGRVPSLDLRHYQQILERAIHGDGGAVDLPGGMKTCLEKDRLVVYRNVAPIPETCVAPGEKVELPDLRVAVEVRPRSASDPSVRNGEVVMDADRVLWPLRVRSAKPGDYFRPLGAGGTKKVHDHFIDSKIPRRLRLSVPIIEDSEKVLSVGERLDERVKVTEKTRMVALVILDRERNERKR